MNHRDRIEFISHEDGTASITLPSEGPSETEPLLNELLLRSANQTPGAKARPGWQRGKMAGALWWIRERDAPALVVCIEDLRRGDSASTVTLLDRWANADAAAAKPQRYSRADAADRRWAAKRLPDLPGQGEADTRGVHIHWEGTRSAAGCRACRQRTSEHQALIIVYLHRSARSVQITLNAEDRARPVPEGTHEELLASLFHAAAWGTTLCDASMIGSLDTHLTISRVRVADAAHVAVCLADLWQGNEDSTHTLLTRLGSRAPDPSQDRLLERRHDRIDRAMIAQHYDMSPIVLPRQPLTDDRPNLSLCVVPATDPTLRKAATTSPPTPPR